MKRIIVPVFTFIIAAFTVTPLFALPNPAAVYCEKLGYEYKIVKTPEGERSVCVIAKDTEFSAWDFYRGKVGKEYSYCAKYGYDTENEHKKIGDFFTECAVCVSKSVDGKTTERISMLELMEKNGEPLMDFGLSDTDVKGSSDCEECQKLTEECDTCPDIKRKGIKQDSIEKRNGLPSSFDWRDVGGQAYIGAIRDQGVCGSCYAFSAVASAEGVYNYAMGLYDGNCAKFSESFIMWCLAKLPEYAPHFGGICGSGSEGADYTYSELLALITYGICPLSYFPYTTTDPGSCTHWGDDRTLFSSWGRVACSDVDTIKTAIVTYGIVDAAVLVGGAFEAYIGGIYDDANTACDSSPCYYTPTDHAIALVGWDDSPPEGGSGVWILRNSWGTDWGENGGLPGGESGYMRLRYTAARVACEVTYLQYTAVATHIIHALSGENGNILPSGNVIVVDGADQTFIITPDKAYQIDDVVVDSTSQGAISSYTFENVTENHTIEASFTLGGDGNGGSGGNGGGGGGGGKGSSNCFIVTACFGTPMADEVKILNRFRDECLLTNPVGKVFVNTYYKISPPVADFIRGHPALKKVARDALSPLIWISKEMTE